MASSVKESATEKTFVFSPQNPITSFLGLRRVSVGQDVLGYGALVIAAMIWGSYSPMVKMLYEIDPVVPGFVLSALYFSVASFSTLGLLAVFPQLDGQDTSSLEDKRTLDFTSEKHPLRNLPLVAGAEIGSYLFLGNSLQVLGLETVPADRAGFLVQLSTIFVPLVDATLKGNLLSIAPRTWAACLIALVGIGIMALDMPATANTLEDAIQASSSVLSGFGTGDLLTIGAAFMYTMCIVRLSSISSNTSPLRLTAAKTTVEMILSCASVAIMVAAAGAGDVGDNAILSFAQSSGNDILHFVDTVSERLNDGTLPIESILKATGATLYCGWIATALLVIVQSYGQRRVQATDANLIYSLQPLFTSLFAFLLLGECMAPVGYVGGSFIAGAIFLVASKPDEAEPQ